MLDLLIRSLSEIKSYVVVLSLYTKMMKERTCQAFSLKHSIKNGMFSVYAKFNSFKPSGGEGGGSPHLLLSLTTRLFENIVMCILKIIFSYKSSVYFQNIVVCILKIICNCSNSVYFGNIVVCILKKILNYNSSVYFENIVVCILKIIFVFICRCIARNF